jgi:hypothetical protein
VTSRTPAVGAGSGGVCSLRAKSRSLDLEGLVHRLHRVGHIVDILTLNADHDKKFGHRRLEPLSTNCQGLQANSYICVFEANVRKSAVVQYPGVGISAKMLHLLSRGHSRLGRSIRTSSAANGRGSSSSSVSTLPPGVRTPAASTIFILPRRQQGESLEFGEVVVLAFTWTRSTKAPTRSRTPRRDWAEI